MRLVTPPLVLEGKAAFEDDIFQRKKFGIALKNIIESSSDALVIALDGKWGEGKTTFIKMWQQLLREDGVHNVYVDAFANDYIDDAFISVASAITAYAQENIEQGKEEKISELKSKAKRIGVQLLSWGARVGVKAATLGAIRDAEIAELADIQADISAGSSKFIGDFIEERLTSHAKDVEAIRSFRDFLSTLPSSLKGESTEKRLVVIIDELDRCKPSFAVEVLEKIKHLFSVENVVFVLVMNKSQLEESIRCVYGANVDAHTYLQKFITLDARLPQNSERGRGDIPTYCRALISLHEIETWGDADALVESISALANWLDLTLRQLERVMTNIALIYGAISERSLRIVPLMSFLAVVKVVRPATFNGMIKGQLNFSEIAAQLGEIRSSDEEVQFLLQHTLNWVRYCVLSKNEFQALPDGHDVKRCSRSLSNYSLRREKLLEILAIPLTVFSYSNS